MAFSVGLFELVGVGDCKQALPPWTGVRPFS
jgi:hypothetical protein